jgi:hypothetical protein
MKIRKTNIAAAFALIFLCAAARAQSSGNGVLKVTSFPSGANVAVDSVNSGKTTPMSISLPAGAHTVTVSIPNSGWNPIGGQACDSCDLLFPTARRAES